MGERSTEHQFGLSEGRDIDKQAPHMHNYRSPAQIAPHHAYLQQLHHSPTGSRVLENTMAIRLRGEVPLPSKNLFTLREYSS